MEVVRSSLLGAKQAAAFLGVSAATLATWRVYRKGPVYVRIGRSIRYDADALKAWVDAGRVEPLTRR